MAINQTVNKRRSSKELNSVLQALQLKNEIISELTNGWSEEERKTQWKSYLEELKSYAPHLHNFLKDVEYPEGFK